MSTLKEYMIESLHRFYRKDNWIENIYRAAGLQMDGGVAAFEELLLNMFFDSASEEATARYEKDLGIITNTDDSLASRQKNVEAKWKGVGKCSLALLQSIADGYNQGKTVAEFVDGSLYLQINSEPIVKYKEMITKIVLTKPAHLWFIVSHNRKLPFYLGYFLVNKKTIVLYPMLTLNTDINNNEYIGIVSTFDNVINIYKA